MQESLVRDEFSVKTGPTKQKISHNLACYKKDTKAVRQIRYFCAQSETSLRMSRGRNGTLRVLHLSPVLENFRRLFNQTRLTAPGYLRMRMWYSFMLRPRDVRKNSSILYGANPPELNDWSGKRDLQIGEGEVLNSDCSV